MDRIRRHRVHRFIHYGLIMELTFHGVITTILRMASINRHRRYNIVRPTDTRRVRRAVVAWACLVLLAFNLVAGTSLSSQPMTVQGDGIVICTAAGMVVLDPSGAPIHDQSPSHEPHCVFCLPLMHGGLDVAEAPSLAAPALPSTMPTVPSTGRITVAARLIGSASPRAPPSA